MEEKPYGDFDVNNENRNLELLLFSDYLVFINNFWFYGYQNQKNELKKHKEG